MSHLRTFYVKYTVAPDELLRTYVVTASTPVKALDLFHIYQQGELSRKPNAYEIARLYFEYHPDPTTMSAPECANTWITSDFDLPTCPNPDLMEKKNETSQEKDTFFRFYDKTPVRLKVKKK